MILLLASMIPASQQPPTEQVTLVQPSIINGRIFYGQALLLALALGERK
jgi:hypothetical protein